MAATARLEGKLTLNDAEFTAALSRAEARSKTFSGKVRHAFSDFGLKNESRVSRQFGQLTTGLLSARSAGDALQSTFTALEYSSKVPIGVGLGLAAGVAVFEKVREQIEATSKAEEHLHSVMNRPMNLVGQLGSSGITKEIDSQKEAMHGLQEQQSTYTQSVIDTFKYGLGVKLPFLPKHKGAFDVQDERQEEQVKAMERLDQLSRARGKAELGVARAHQLGADGYEREASLAETAAKFDEKRAAIRLDTLDAGTGDRLKALDQEQAITESVINKRADAKDAELEMAIKIANIEAGRVGGGAAFSPTGLGFQNPSSAVTTPMQRKILALRAQIAENDAASRTANPSELKGLTAQRIGLQSALNDAQYDYAQTTPEQRTAARMDAQKRQQFARAMNREDSRDSFGVHKGAYGFRSTKPTLPDTGKADDSDKAVTEAQLDKIMAKYWEGSGG